MTVNTEVSSIQYTGIIDGVDLAAPFPVQATGEITVYYGANLIATEGVHYTVTLDPPEYLTATVTPKTGFAALSGGNIGINHVIPYTQPTDIPAATTLATARLEQMFDRLTFMSQQLRDQLVRVLRFPFADQPSSFGDLPTAADRANKYLAFDGTGKPWAAMIAADLTGVSAWLASNLLPLSTAISFYRFIGVRPPIEYYGAKGDGTTDDSAAFSACATAGMPIMLDGTKTYVIKNVNIPSGSLCPAITSTGGQARIIPPAGTTSSDAFFIIRKESDFTVDSVFFDMPVAASNVLPPAFNRALWFAPTIDNTVTNVRVEHCKFVGGTQALTGVGYIVRNSVFINNYITQTYADGMSFNACINVDIVDNILEDCGITNNTVGPTTSGAIRTGTNDQLDMTFNLTIARNIITGCNVDAKQSAIDCFSGAARNILITDNNLSYNGSGIELKTKIWTQPSPLPPGATEVYEHLVVSNNVIRMFSDRDTTGITCFHADPGSVKGKGRNVKICANVISSTAAVTPGVYSHYGISVSGYDQVMIDSNFVINGDHGIAVGGLGPVSDTSDNIMISNNYVDVAGVAVQHSGGTVNSLFIRDNPLLRVGAAATAAALEISFAGTTVEVSANRIESKAGRALEMRAVTNARVTNNTIVGGGAAAAIIMQGTAVNGAVVRDNQISSTVGPAASLSTGTGIELRGNDIDIPAASRTWSGAATVLAAGNVRGMATSDPTATTGGSLGDLFLDSSGATRGWRCTTAGAVGTSVYSAA